MLLLEPYQARSDRTAKAFNPLPPKNPEATPRYACGGCERVLLTGVPLVELKQRLAGSAGTDEVAVRCQGCGSLNATRVVATKHVPRSDEPQVAPAPGAQTTLRQQPHPWHVSRTARSLR